MSNGIAASVEPNPPSRLTDLVVCSLEAWDEVWRRNQFLVDLLLRRNPELRVLFVEPPVDPIFDISSRRVPLAPRLRTLGYGGRLRALRPLKALPRRLGLATDAMLCAQVRLTAWTFRFSHPTLWLNDVTYGQLISSTGWPTVYDVTDDWLAAPFSSRELARLERLEQRVLAMADAVTTCSSSLAASRGRSRPVTLIRNAVDIEHFRRPQNRPADLPPSPVAVYIGTLHESRLDLGVVVGLARSLPSLNVVLVGPDSLAEPSRRKLVSEPNITLTGPRPYAQVPAYLQHSDVVVVPHLNNDFTESLDPIKAYECLACETPTVATPVAGFRELGSEIKIALPVDFVTAVEEALSGIHSRSTRPLPTWGDRARDFERILRGVR